MNGSNNCNQERYIFDLFNEIKGKIIYIFIKDRIAIKALHIT